MLVNIFDNAFKHYGCSTDNHWPKNIQYTWEKMNWDGITIFTEDYLYDPIVHRVNSPIKIGWLIECKELSPGRYLYFEGVKERFNFTLTHDKVLLETYPNNTKKNIMGGYWIKSENVKLYDKSKSVSMIYSNKNFMPGHGVRHAIANNFNGLIDFYGSGSANPISEKEIGLRDYMFSIAVENSKCDNYFTEKLLDCFATGTIPIYWGCPNIGEYFDTESILSFDSLEDLKSILNTITPELYLKKLESLSFNIEQIKKYENTEDYIYNNYLKDFDK